MHFPPARHRLALALAVTGIGFVIFALIKSRLGLDFTDEGLYVVAPQRLAMGEKLFSREIMTLLRPAEIVSQVFFAFGEPSLVGLRLVGWALHIVAYLVLAATVARESRSTVLGCLAAAIPFFISFAWPSSIATPGYKSLSSDFLLLFLCGFFAANRWPDLPGRPIRVAAGLALAGVVVCYPSLVVVLLLTCAYEGWRCTTAPAANRRLRINTILMSGAGVGALAILAGILLVNGAVAAWLEKAPLVHNTALTSFRDGILPFYGNMLWMLCTKVPRFEYYSLVAAGAALGLLAAPRAWQEAIRPPLLVGFTFYSLWVLYASYRGDDELAHFFYPTAFCLVAVAGIVVQHAAHLRSVAPRDPVGAFCLLLSLVAALVYATSTYFFDYYYSWNSGLLGLPFAFAFYLGTQAIARCRDSTVWSGLLAAGLLVGLATAVRYNYHGVRLDSPVSRLTATFQVPALRGIRSTPERVAAVEALHAYLHPRLGSSPLLAFDNCPMLYFILRAPPAYGLCWAIRYTVAESAHRHLLDDLRSRPLPAYAVRAVVSLSETDWNSAPKIDYGPEYRLNSFVESHYELEKVIFPFEIFRLRESAGTGAGGRP